jgi:hypothetical protein
MLELFNEIWRAEGVCHTTPSGRQLVVEHPVYQVATVEGLINGRKQVMKGGFIEPLPDFHSVSDIEKGAEHGLAWKPSAELIPSTVATFVGAFVVDLRDRHKDNFGLSGRKLGNIDFGWLGESPGFGVAGRRVEVDTARFSIPEGLEELLKRCRSWRIFRQLCWEAIKVLRRRRGVIAAHWHRLLQANELYSDGWMRDEMLEGMRARLAISQDDLWEALDTRRWSTWVKDATHAHRNAATVNAVKQAAKTVGLR